MNKYYVYEWFIVDTDEVFYVGKGKGKRAWQLKENRFFMNMYNTHNCDVRIKFNNLKENKAFEKEVELIKFYRNNTNYRLTNIADGGNQPPIMRGEEHPMYKLRGKLSPSYGRKLTEKAKKKLSVQCLERYKNKENHPCYNRKMKEETINKIKEGVYKTTSNEEWKKKHSEKMKKVYNNKKAVDLTRKRIVQLSLEGEYIKTYKSQAEASEELNISFRGISKNANGNSRSYKGFVWVLENKYDINKDYSIKGKYANTVPSLRNKEGVTTKEEQS